MISDYIATQQKLAEAKQALVEKKAEQMQEKKVLLEQKKALKLQMKERSATLKKLRKGKTKFTTELLDAKELQATLEAQERAIAAAKAAAKAAAEKAAAEKAAAEKAAKANAQAAKQAGKSSESTDSVVPPVVSSGGIRSTIFWWSVTRIRTSKRRERLYVPQRC